MILSRGNFAGVLSILRYNQRSYAASFCLLLGVGALLWLRFLPWSVELVLGGAAGLTLFWSASSLLASYYVYDYVGVTRWTWLPRSLSFPPKTWLNIHVGLDESSQILTELYPNSQHVVLDIYDPLEMTEPSIAIARRTNQAENTAAGFGKLDALPLPDAQQDTVFLLFAAHEIRKPQRRSAFFLEISRVLGNSGQLLLVEHLRDWKNFVAFGPGFLHFYPQEEWRRLAREVGFIIAREESVTPLVRCFLMRKIGK